MNYKYILILKFENAGIFQKSFKQDGTSRSKDDRVFTDMDGEFYSPGSRKIRKSTQWINQTPGTLHHSFVEQSLRVLCGLRPFPKYRGSCVNGSQLIADMAKRSLVKTTSHFSLHDKEKKNVYVYEKMTTRKSVDNCWATPEVSWVKLSYLIPEATYNDFIIFATDLLKYTVTDKLLLDVCREISSIKDVRKDNFLNEIEDINFITPFRRLLTNDIDGGVQQMGMAGYQKLGQYLKTMVVKGVSDIARIDGEISVQLTEDEMLMFNNGCGFASILEGGVVSIKELFNLEETNSELLEIDFKPVEL